MKTFVIAMLAAAAISLPDLQKEVLSLFATYPYYVYAILTAIAVAEGPLLSIICGTLIKLGFVPFIPIYLCLMAGDLIGDVFWYYLGYHFGHRFVRHFGHWFGVTERGVEKVSSLFHKHKHKILLINKLTMGFGFCLATLITAGIVRIPFKQYMLVNTIGQIFWTLFLIGIGYFVGQAYTVVADAIGAMGKLGLIAAFIALAYGIHEYKKFVTRRAAVFVTA